MNNRFWNLLIVTTLIVCSLSCAKPKVAENKNWKDRLRDEISLMGHRNWIVVADAAYPKQSNPAIETIVVKGDQLNVLSIVLNAIQEAPHVQAEVVVDQELYEVSESDAPGISEYRKALDALLENQDSKKVLHEEIINRLDQDAKLFNVLLLKTNMMIPYTSVFIRLDCGYWSQEKETRLRDSM